jgi:apolipoprotein N-acyltransferase
LIARIDRRHGERWLVAALGGMLPLAFAPFHLYPLALVLIALLFLLWERQTPGETAWRAFLFGFAAFATGTYWLYISIRGFGGAPMPVVVLLMFGGFFLMGLYLALAGFLAGALAVEPRWLRWCFAWPTVFTFVEWLRTWLFFGFPWLSLGYGQIDGPLRAWAPVLGVHGVTLATATLAGAGLTLVRGDRRDRLVAGVTVASILVATAGLYDRDWTEPAAEELRYCPESKSWVSIPRYICKPRRFASASTSSRNPRTRWATVGIATSGQTTRSRSRSANVSSR